MGFIPINIGFGNQINADKIDVILRPDSAPIKRMIHLAKEQERLIDATYGRKTRSVIVMMDGRIILASIQPETVADRAKILESNVLVKRRDEIDDEDDEKD